MNTYIKQLTYLNIFLKKKKKTFIKDKSSVPDSSSQALVHVQSKINQINNLKPYLLKMYFLPYHTILPLIIYMCPKWSLPFRFCVRLSFPCVLYTSFVP